VLPGAEKVNQVITGATKPVVDAVNQLNKTQTQITNGATPNLPSLVNQTGDALNHFGVEVDKSVLQPIWRGVSHLAQQLDIVGKAENAAQQLIDYAQKAAQQLIAAVDSKAADRMAQAGTLGQSLIRNAMFFLFLALTGTGVVLIGMARILRRAR
jgi:hypothetical protein